MCEGEAGLCTDSSVGTVILSAPRDNQHRSRRLLDMAQDWELLPCPAPFPSQVTLLQHLQKEMGAWDSPPGREGQHLGGGRKGRSQLQGFE